jgi:flagellum-specific peptidoglycan hydrolase FlgJ
MVKFMITMFLLSICLSLHAPEYHTIPIQQAEKIWQVDLNYVNALIKKYNIKNSNTALTQVCLETGYLTSDILKANKNLFGMRYAPGRKTAAIGEQFGSAVYASIEKSVEDYKIWQDLYYKGGDYYLFLERIGYATDPVYIEKLKRIKKQL